MHSIKTKTPRTRARAKPSSTEYGSRNAAASRKSRSAEGDSVRRKPHCFQSTRHDALSLVQCHPTIGRRKRRQYPIAADQVLARPGLPLFLCLAGKLPGIAQDAFRPLGSAIPLPRLSSRPGASVLHDFDGFADGESIQRSAGMTSPRLAHARVGDAFNSLSLSLVTRLSHSGHTFSVTKT